MWRRIFQGWSKFANLECNYHVLYTNVIDEPLYLLWTHGCFFFYSRLYGYNFTIFKILIFRFSYYFSVISGAHNSHGARWLMSLYLLCRCSFQQKKNVRAGDPSCNLEMLDKLLKRMCRTVGPSLAASFEPLAHRRNVAGWRFFHRYFGIGKISSELAQPVRLSYFRSNRYSDRLHDFSVTIGVARMYVDSFFTRTTKLWNSLPIESFALAYDLNGFRSRINGHLPSVGSF